MSDYPKSRWLMLAAVVSGYMMVGAIIICYAPILGIVAKDIGVSAGEASAAAMATLILSAAVSAIISGPILDKFGVQRSITLGALITFTGVLLAPVLSGSVKEIVVVRIIMGLGLGPVSACTSAVAAKWFPPKERAMVAGMVGAGISLGTILGFILTPAFLAAVDHWSLAIRNMAVVPFIALVLAFVTNFLAEPAMDQTGSGENANGTDISLAFKSPATYVCIFCMFLFSWAMNAFNNMTPGFIAITPPVGLGKGPALAGQFMSAVQVGMMVGSALAGPILMKIFKGSIKSVLAVGFIFTAVFMFSVKVSVINSTSSLLAAFLFLAGFFQAFTIPMAATFIAMHYPAAITGRVFGTAFGISVFGGAVGVFVASAFLHHTGGYFVSIAITSATSLVGMAAALFLKPPKAFA